VLVYTYGKGMCAAMGAIVSYLDNTTEVLLSSLKEHGKALIVPSALIAIETECLALLQLVEYDALG
jgi:hypothetical protein